MHNMRQNMNMLIKFEGLFLLVILIQTGAGLKLCDASDKYLEVEEGKENNVFTCSELESHVNVQWALDDVNTVLGTCTPPPDLRCEVNIYTTIFSLSRSAADTASIAVNAKAALTKDIFWTNDLVCQSFSTANKKLAETRCSFDYISPPKSPACSLQFSASPWGVTGQCSAADVFSKRERYYCLLYQTDSRNPSNTQFVGRFNMTATPTPGTNYSSATCQIETLLPAEGNYNYSVVVFPGQVKILPFFNGSTEIKRPNQSPTHNCPQYVQEGRDMNCLCNTSNLGNPPGNLVWNERTSSELKLNTVNRTLNGLSYICSLNWNNTAVQSTSFTLTVNYSSKVLNFKIGQEDEAVPENSSLAIVCEVEGRPTPVIRLLKENKDQSSQDINQTDNLLKLQYNMTAVQCESAGTYVCQTKNIVGNDEQKVHLNVSCAPRRSSMHNKSYSASFTGEEAKLEFEMIAYPAPRLLSVFYLGLAPSGITGDRMKSENVTQLDCTPHSVYAYIVVCTVTLKKKDVFIGGWYNATFGNKLGNISITFEVKQDTDFTTTTGAGTPPNDLAGPVAGGIIGGLVVIGVVVGIAVFIMRRNGTGYKNTSLPSNTEGQSDNKNENDGRENIGDVYATVIKKDQTNTTTDASLPTLSQANRVEAKQSEKKSKHSKTPGKGKQKRKEGDKKPLAKKDPCFEGGGGALSMSPMTGFEYENLGYKGQEGKKRRSQGDLNYTTVVFSNTASTPTPLPQLESTEYACIVPREKPPA